MKYLSSAYLILSVAVNSVSAQELPREVGESQAGAAAHCKASHLVGSAVIDSKSKSLGSIQDIVLDIGNHRIAYAVLVFNKSAGLGDKCFLMPWRLIEIGRSSAAEKLHATLSLDPLTLKAAPSFGSSEWPDMTEATWSKQVDSYYSSQIKNLPTNAGLMHEGSALTIRMPSHCLLTKLYGTEVIDKHRRTLATAEDLVVDTGSGTVDSVLLSFGGDLGRGECFALVPSESLSISKSGALVLPCSHAGLKTMALKDGELPVLNQNAWLNNARRLYAKAGKDALVGSGEVIPDGTTATPSAVFSDSYDLASVQTIKGEITTIGSVQVGKSREERVRLRIVVGKGREVIVYAAPAIFEHQQALGLRTGSTVEVTGAPAKHCTHTVLMAGDITSSGKTAKLRDSQGHPSWVRN